MEDDVRVREQLLQVGHHGGARLRVRGIEMPGPLACPGLHGHLEPRGEQCPECRGDQGHAQLAELPLTGYGDPHRHRPGLIGGFGHRP